MSLERGGHVFGYRSVFQSEESPDSGKRIPRLGGGRRVGEGKRLEAGAGCQVEGSCHPPQAYRSRTAIRKLSHSGQTEQRFPTIFPGSRVPGSPQKFRVILMGAGGGARLALQST